MEAILSVLPVYFFILLGFTAKKIFTNEINEKTLVLLSLYFFQPILIFWGLTKAPINYEFIASPFFYLVIVLFCLILLLFLSKIFFKSRTEESIYLATSLVGNTGNLGIPLGIALFGVESVPYTSIINIANIIFIYIFSVYFFAREQFSIKEAIFSILKIPGIWFALLALFVNYHEITINKHIYTALEMGAYTSMVIQLLIFGIYLYSVKIKTIPWHLTLHINFVKHILLPIIGIIIVVNFTQLDSFVASILIMELMVPLAVNNVNIAALYNCKPFDVAATVLVSTALFVGLLYFYIYIIEYFIK
ncbi:AEC family transporter [Arcobacter aquimarinus]|uniref:AEC family transporter n=1 Tax=Arcobacter aquimarinus TaxID=1315211 RepID=UPI00100AC07F|nr:AEC family transporter [Arcobacter aquimarinus]MCB9097844.1 AEC family transporter [Arcobacter sp.]RXI35054.1 permease [Arcobacter aquimarinus]